MKILKTQTKNHAVWLDHAETAACWYLNNQCTEQQPWGDVLSNANLGRFLYEVYKATGKRRGAGNWAQALGIIDLFDLAQRTGEERYARAAMLGAHYLVSLQNLDSRHPECSGGLWEHYPAEGIGMSRDMTTGCFGLAALARHTDDPDYRERTQLFCDWYMKYGRRPDGWPWRYFDYKARRGYSAVPGSTPDEAIAGKGHVDGDWQIGGALCLYYSGKALGRPDYLEAGFRPMVNLLLDLYDRDAADPDNIEWHGSNPVTFGNDDFALVALMAACREWKDERCLARIQERERRHLDWMAEDGSYPNYGGTFVCGIEHIEYLKLAMEFGFTDMTDEVRASLEKTAVFGLTLQERDSGNPLIYGGLYGQSSYGIGRDRIHHRSTGYSINFYLKLEALENPALPWPRGFSAFGWE